jgi:hypothetical protein
MPIKLYKPDLFLQSVGAASQYFIWFFYIWEHTGGLCDAGPMELKTVAGQRASMYNILRQISS